MSSYISTYDLRKPIIFARPEILEYIIVVSRAIDHPTTRIWWYYSCCILTLSPKTCFRRRTFHMPNIMFRRLKQVQSKNKSSYSLQIGINSFKKRLLNNSNNLQMRYKDFPFFVVFIPFGRKLTSAWTVSDIFSKSHISSVVYIHCIQY